mmetsp:Transcript_67/g.145  ORF Transcript_67/g.145 Transcript_67/m.145 type:complete len:256 (-) Transcript_67:129-896(-)
MAMRPQPVFPNCFSFSWKQAPRYDAYRFMDKLRGKCRLGNGALDWDALGHQCGACFNAVPSGVRFLAGPLDGCHDYTPRTRTTRRAPRVQEEEEEEITVRAQQQQIPAGDSHLSAVERNIKDLRKVLKKQCLRKQKHDLEEVAQTDDPEEKETKRQRVGEVGLVETLWNPHSFCQTVENLFHASFMVKNGELHLGVNEKGPTLKMMRRPEEDQPCRQAIISLNMRDFRRLRDARGMAEPLVPHRTPPEGSRPSSA